MNYSESLAYIESFINYSGAGKGRRFPDAMKRLSRISALAEFAGSPQTAFPAVLVGGTKGKGSTASFLARILETAGYRTGLYLSPHLVTIRERILINSRRISKDDFASAVTELKPYLDAFEDRLGKTTPSYFEILTACAFLFFKTAGVDIAVIEVGMGGKYDATNIIEPLMSVITSIGLEHTEFLGSTIPEITAEKCGIMREGKPVVTSAADPEALSVIESEASRLNAPLYRLDREITLSPGTTVGMSFKGVSAEDTSVPLPGAHQLRNAAAAFAAAVELNAHDTFDITTEHIREGIRNTQIMGRIDIVRKDPLTIFDTAHTADSIQSLTDTLNSRYPEKDVYGVFNLSKDKDLDRIITAFPPRCVRIYTAPTGNPRNYDHEELASLLVQAGVPAEPASSVPEAVGTAEKQAGQDGLVLVFGSFFITGLAYEYLGYTDE